MSTGHDTGHNFPFYFAVAAISLGAASVMNSMLVMRLGMRLLTHRALVATSLLSAAFLIAAVLQDGVQPLWRFMIWLLAIFFAWASCSAISTPGDGAAQIHLVLPIDRSQFAL